MPARKPTIADTADALNSAGIHLLRGLRDVDRRSGLGSARLSALSVLVYGGPCTQAALAAAEGVTAATMSRVVDGLVAEGLAERAPHPESRRAFLVSATADGRRRMESARAARLEVIGRALRALGPEDRGAIGLAVPALRRLAADVPRRAQSG